MSTHQDMAEYFRGRAQGHRRNPSQPGSPADFELAAAVIDQLSAAIEQGAAWFDEYAELHRRKLKPRPADVFFENGVNAHNDDVRAKVERNRERAAFLRAAAAPPPQPS